LTSIFEAHSLGVIKFASVREFAFSCFCEECAYWLTWSERVSLGVETFCWSGVDSLRLKRVHSHGRGVYSLRMRELASGFKLARSGFKEE
jgi:hypothetical protein